MPRKHKNARQKPRLKKLKLKQPRAVLLPIKKRRCEISPGWLVAVAEWREMA